MKVTLSCSPPCFVGIGGWCQLPSQLPLLPNKKAPPTPELLELVAKSMFQCMKYRTFFQDESMCSDEYQYLFYHSKPKQDEASVDEMIKNLLFGAQG